MSAVSDNSNNNNNNNNGRRNTESGRKRNYKNDVFQIPCIN
jgi:hypothetical protein